MPIIKKEHSTRKLMTTGVPQGSILGYFFCFILMTFGIVSDIAKLHCSQMTS